MKESSLYLSFFRKNILFFFVLPLLCLGMMFYYLKSKPVIYQISRLYEMQYDQNNLSNKIAETDQAVTLLRSNHLAQELGLKTSPIIFKPGPVSLNIKTESSDKKVAEQDLNKLAFYLQNKYQVNSIGKDFSETIFPFSFSHLFIAFGGGLFLSLLVSLIKTYFEKY